MPSLRHLVITRFSYRGCADGSAGPGWFSKHDPLEPERLAFRRRVFETTCLPSLAGQACQDFDWILVVDPALPSRDFKRLQSLISRRERSFIHVRRRTEDLRNINWLRAYVKDAPDYLVTTNVDDDDALSSSYIGALQKRVHSFDAARRATPFMAFGTRRAVEWDMLASSQAPFGTVAPWHRTINGRPFVVSCGYSLCALYPIYDCTVFGLPEHPWAERIFDPGCADSRCAAIRLRFREIAENNCIEYPRSLEMCFYDLGQVTEAGDGQPSFQRSGGAASRAEAPTADRHGSRGVPRRGRGLAAGDRPGWPAALMSGRPTRRSRMGGSIASSIA